MGRVKVSCPRMDIQLSDFITVGLLIVLEGLLSADNALVVAVMILGLPRAEQKNALRYGLMVPSCSARSRRCSRSTSSSWHG